MNDGQQPETPEPDRSTTGADAATREEQEAHGGSMAPQFVDDTGRPTQDAPPSSSQD